jgi:arylsulfatase A-like enzyme
MGMLLRVFIIVGLILFILLPAGCSGERDVSRNVLLILMDTVRADKLGCYGNTLGATPRIDRLVEEGVLFERAYSHSPWTLPSCASILTSMYPPQHGAGGQEGGFLKLNNSVRTLSECFQDAGFTTGAVVNVDFLTDRFGMTQGFDDVDQEIYSSNVKMRPAIRTTNAAINWIKKYRDQRFFLMVHYFDPHLVYAPPLEYRQRFAMPEDRYQTSWVFGSRPQIAGYRHGQIQFDDASIKRAEHLYNGEIAYTDNQIGRLLDKLEEMGLAKSTVVVLTVDHGEEFLDHGGFEHGHTLYDELVRVPLIFRVGEEIEPGQRISSVVGHVDLAPTLCEMVGIEPAPTFVGKSLVPHMTGENIEDHSIIFEGNFWGEPIRGWLQGDYKLIQPYGEDPMLFNIADDPLEKHDLREADPRKIEQMSEDMELAYKHIREKRRGKGSIVELTPEETERLRSLGYIK